MEWSRYLRFWLGRTLLAWLSNETFNEGIGLDRVCKGATVDLKLKYKTASVPEPGTMMMLGSVLLGLVAVSRKRFNRS